MNERKKGRQQIKDLNLRFSANTVISGSLVRKLGTSERRESIAWPTLRVNSCFFSASPDEERNFEDFLVI